MKTDFCEQMKLSVSMFRVECLFIETSAKFGSVSAS